MYLLFIDGVQFPVAPSSIETTINNRNKTYDLVNGGQINLIKRAGLTDISFELLIPNKPYPFSNYPNGFQNASYYLNVLEQVKLKNEPSRFNLLRRENNNTLYDTNFLVTLEDYRIREEAENGTDVIVPINLKQYVAQSTKVLNIRQNTNTTARTVSVTTQRPTTGKVTPKTYTVVAGDTLFGIAKRFLNNGNLFRQLATRNNIPNPNLIRVGQVIRLD